jgi:hypothetical protein
MAFWLRRQQTPAQLRAQGQGLYGTPYTDAQMRAMAGTNIHSIIDPQLAQINRSYADKARLGGEAIRNVTDAYAKSLGSEAGTFHDIYGTAAGQINRLNDALGTAMAGGGAGAEFNGALAGAGQDMGAADQFAQLTQNAGNDALASNVSAEQALIGAGAGYAAYGAAVPGFARQQGIGEIGRFANTVEQGRQAETGALTSRIPQMISDAYNQYLNQNQATRTSTGNFVSAGLDRNQTGLLAAQAAAAEASRFKVTSGQNQQSIDYQTGRPYYNPNTTTGAPGSFTDAQIQNFYGATHKAGVDKFGQKTMVALPFAQAQRNIKSYLMARGLPSDPASVSRAMGAAQIYGQAAAPAAAAPSVPFGQPTITPSLGPGFAGGQFTAPQINPPASAGTGQTPPQPGSKPAGHPRAVWHANASPPGWFEQHAAGRGTIWQRVK